jgi:hypothetical protein
MKYLILSNKKSVWKKIKNPDSKGKEEPEIFGFESEK